MIEVPGQGTFTWWPLTSVGDEAEWQISGSYRTGSKGVEVTNLLLEPALNRSQADGPPIDSDTLRLIRIDKLRSSIARELDEVASQFRRQLAATEKVMNLWRN